MEQDLTGSNGLETSQNDGILVDQVVITLIGEFLDQHYSQIMEFRASLRSNSRELRKLSFRAYYESIESEEHRLMGMQDDLLKVFLENKGVSFPTYLARVSEVEFKKLYTTLAGKTLSARMMNNLREEEEVTRSQLEECLQFREQLMNRAQSSPGWDNHNLRYVLCRMIEDDCFDRFGLDEAKLMNLGYLFNIWGLIK